MSGYYKALNILMKSPVTDDMIRFLTNTTLKVLPQSNYPSPPGSPGKSGSRLPSLMSFISRLVRHTNVYTPTLLATACYLNKLKCILPKDASGLPSTIHRIFLACLILSAKFHNDSSPLNKHWAKYTDGLFSVEDVNLMERQLVQLLNWDLRVTNDDLILDLRYLLEPIVEDLERTSAQRKKLQKQIQLQKLRHQQHKQQVQLQLQAKPRVACAGAGDRFASVKTFDHQRNASVSSDLSAATLVSEASELDIWNKADFGKPLSRLSSVSTMDSLDRYGAHLWNCEQDTLLQQQQQQAL
ncbi:PCL1 (YNL289W) [Zygosaccharomyces parabailii]|nr:PCL1 (YNL289W) [Zygosaccharomyces parabailii]CDH15282.1 related to PHO85 cyclin-1 [Zygosaccharomyces bailii ISA1307]